jgi:hypothetical protein
MKRIAIFTLLLALTVAWLIPAKAESTGAEENTQQSQKAANKATKKQQQMSKKAAKQQRKAMKKYDKAQRKLIENANRSPDKTPAKRLDNNKPHSSETPHEP